MVKTPVDGMLFPGDGPAELFVKLPASSINTAIADHLKMFFRDMPDQTLNKLHDRDGLFHIFIILMPVVVESDQIAVIPVNAGSGDHRPAKIAPDILDSSFRVTGIGSGIDIEAIFMLPVAAGFDLIKRRPDPGFHFIQQGGTKSVAQISIVKMRDPAPEAVIAITAFGEETVDVRVPF